MQAPGIVYLASELQQAAEKRWRRRAAGALPAAATLPLSLRVEPGASGLTIASAPVEAGAPAPKLKAKRLRDGTIELSLRPGQLASPPAGAGAAPAHHRPRAWPFAALGPESLLHWEALLRSVLAAHPHRLPKVAQRGVGLRLDSTRVSSMSLLKFEMHLLAPAQPPVAVALPGAVAAPGAGDAVPQVWEAFVQLQLGKDGNVEYLPLKVQRKAAFYSTLSLAGSRDASVRGLGYESSEMGVARAVAAGNAEGAAPQWDDWGE